MTAFRATKLFQAQLERALAGLTWCKVILLPNTVGDTSLLVSIAVRKPERKQATMGVKVRTLKLIVAVTGRIESETGLEMAMDAIEAVSAFLLGAKYLEDDTAVPIADMRISSEISDEDGILEDPETGGRAWAREEFSVSINLPEGA